MTVHSITPIVTDRLQVTELNIFAQKSVDCYRGFAQVYAQSHSTRPRSGDSTLERDPDDDDTLLCELFVQLPKVSQGNMI